MPTHAEELEARIDRFARRLRGMELELEELRREVRPMKAEAAPEPELLATTPPLRSPELPEPLPWPRDFEWRPKVTLSDLLGARTLAWTGGVVTLLGIVLLFALAVNRGWIGPVERVGIGALASALVFAAGFWLRHRFGETYSSLAAVGAGIAGGYATLLAAASLYHLVPDPAALAIAAGIAGVGVATSLLWTEEIIAALGLVGAILVPVPVSFQDGPTVLGTSFAALVLAAAAIVAVARRWNALLVAGTVASAPQVAALVWQANDGDKAVLAVGAAVAAVYLAAGIAEQLRAAKERLTPLPVGLIGLSASLAGATSAALLAGLAEGFALLALAGVYGGLAAALFGRRDLSALLAAVSLSLSAVALADLLSGQALATAWAAEAAVLAWLGKQVGERRYQLGAIAFLGLAVGHVFAFDAPGGDLFTDVAHPAHGVPSVGAAAAAAAVLAYFERRVRAAALLLSGLLAVYAASLGLVAALGFASGHVAVSALWALAGTAVLYGGTRRRQLLVEQGAAIWLTLTFVKAFVYDPAKLDTPRTAYSWLCVGALVLAAGLIHQLVRRRRDLGAGAYFAVAGSAVMLGPAVAMLIERRVPEGLALLGLGAAYGVIAVALFDRQRSLSLLPATAGLVVAGVGSAELLSDTWLVLAWAVAAAALAWLADRTGERRLQLGSLAFLALTIGHVLTLDAPPRDLFVAGRHPGSGAVGAALAALATAPFVRYARENVFGGEPPQDPWPRAAYDLDAFVRRLAPWVAAGLAVFSGSLGILEAAEAVGGGSVHLNFQHGHTAVSAFWGGLGLAALYFGLTRRSRNVRLTGFAMFGISLVKLFLYDLSSLSSVTRALSFLAVGALLLLGGFFYQRLSVEFEERQAARPLA